MGGAPKHPLACWRSRRSVSARVRFTDAVPARSDRRELRRVLRRATWTDRSERKEAMTRELVQLSRDRVPVVAMKAGPVDGSEIVEFAGGIRLLLNVRDGSVAILRLERRMPRAGVCLERVRPTFGCCWYRLRFSPSGGPEIIARVVPFVVGPPLPAPPLAPSPAPRPPAARRRRQHRRPTAGER
ncbi:MAG: hypothetical protein ACRDY3_14340 [Acidimicrobiales bacterium]